MFNSVELEYNDHVGKERSKAEDFRKDGQNERFQDKVKDLLRPKC